MELTEEEFAALTLKQILILRAAQTQKDNMELQLEKDKQSAKILLLANNMARSSVYERLCEELTAEYEAKLEELREKTVFNIANSSDVSDYPSAEEAPYLVDYNLSLVARVEIVKEYYLSIEDPELRMRTYAGDAIAKKYLEDYYAALYAILEQYSVSV